MLLLTLGLAVVVILVLIAKFNFNPFIVLYVVSIVLAHLLGVPPDRVIAVVREGLGNVVGYIGIFILAGYVIAEFLERSGGVFAIGDLILNRTNPRNVDLAVGSAGFLLAPPLMCGLTAFIALSPVSRALAVGSGVPLYRVALILFVGAMSSFSFVLPAPGILAATTLMGADFATTLMLGLAVAVPVFVFGCVISRWYCDRIGASVEAAPDSDYEELRAKFDRIPGVLPAFTPIAIPITLILTGALADRLLASGPALTILATLGNPLYALIIGMVSSMVINRRIGPREQSEWVERAISRSASVILLVGAGGVLGAVLGEVDAGGLFHDLIVGTPIPPIILPFVLSALIKAAQGSAIVSVSTAAAVSAPLVASLGLQPEIAVLACCAGALVPVVLVNDSNFWVFIGFSKLSPGMGLKALTTVYIMISVFAMTAIWLLSLIV